MIFSAKGIAETIKIKVIRRLSGYFCLNVQKGMEIFMAFEIFTDTACSLTADIIAELDIKVVSFPIIINGNEETSEIGKLDMHWLYDKMRAKEDVKTSLINTDRFMSEFEPYLKEGKDVFYTGLASVLSGTFSCAAAAADILMEKYPERKVVLADSKSASLGIGIMVMEAARMRNSGKTIEEVKAYVEQSAKKMNHLVVINDLFFLKRGGRISEAEAIIGSLAKIKPLIILDAEGKVEITGKVAGKKRAFSKIISEMAQSADKDAVIGILHCDCEEDALYVKEKVEEAVPNKTMLAYVDPIIGTHVGPDGLALIFLGKER